MQKMIVIAGPCVIETEDMIMTTAEKLRDITDKFDIDYYFKASFDKANRTSISSFRGPGIEEGMRILNKVKKTFDVKIATDIHEPWQADIAGKVADIIQIPAFLCRQTDLLVAAAKTGKYINIKKAQFLAPWDMKNVAQKVVESGNHNLFLCERGTSFGYNNLVVDMTSLVEMKKIGFPVLFDATHSVQKPGGKGNATGGNREYVAYLARAAMAVGVDGFFMEVHPCPDKALSDGPNMISFEEFDVLLNQLTQMNELMKGF